VVYKNLVMEFITVVSFHFRDPLRVAGRTKAVKGDQSKKFHNNVLIYHIALLCFRQWKTLKSHYYKNFIVCCNRL